MAERPIVCSSVVLVEEIGGRYPGFLLQERPDLPGQLVHPGKWHFFGGHANEGDDRWSTIFREVLDEEAKLRLSRPGSWAEWQHIEQGRYDGTDRHGKSVIRIVNLFHLVLPEATLTLEEKGALVTIPKTVEAIEANRERLTEYAYTHLLARMKGEGPWKKTESGIWK